jgi:phosphoribosylanthranilate isomerase
VLREGGALPDPLPSRVLYEGAVSGTGRTADWAGAHAVARRAEVLLAGGLNPDNVAEAIRVVGPWGVDVSSGVEAAPGVKSPTKILQFVAAARAAAAATAAAAQSGR